MMERDRLKDNVQEPPQPPAQKKEEPPEEIPTTKFQKPFIVGYMSVDANREYHNDLTQLKFLNYIPKGRVHFDLNHNIHNAVKRTTDENDEKITLLLKFILDQKYRIQALFKPDLIISYRRTLISVMCNRYTKKPVTIVASYFDDSIYMCSVQSPEEMLQNRTYKDRDKFCAWGYKFEQYMLAEFPRRQPDINKPVLENEEFSMYYFSQYNKHRLLYGAQIDAMLDIRGNRVVDLPETDGIASNVAFLRKNAFAELKTNKEIQNHFQAINYKSYKLLRCWCQCYLAGLKGLLVGYRNDDGIVKRLQWIETDKIIKFCEGRWSALDVVIYLDDFLNFVKNSFKSAKAQLGDRYDSAKPLTLKFHINEFCQFRQVKTAEELPVILPDWYVKTTLQQK